MTISGKYTKLTILHPEKTVDANWIDENYDKILEELYFAANRLDQIVKDFQNKKKKKKK